MLSKNQIKRITSLHQKKYRELSGEFLAEGEKLVAEAIGSNCEVKELFALADWLNQNKLLINEHNIKAQEITPDELTRISLLKTPNKVLAIAKVPPMPVISVKMFDDLVLVLDNIRDPGNLGTIIRTADWFGIRNIVCSVGCVDAYNPKVVQATMGSVFRVDLFYLDLKEFLQSVPPGIMTFGCLLDGENIYTTHLQCPAIIAIGNESNGISSDLLPLINKRIRIPSNTTVPYTGYNGQAESLNASLANAIVCYEFRRQQSIKLL
ncbi:MAG: TrmH family RNA methyltransferase [Bacteroidales bacterium]